MRMLVRFGKRDRLRFVSHLDLQRFMQRALRRTNLPIAYSQGFNPHPQLSFASALAMGWESEYEVMDVKLTQEVLLEEARASMAGALPPGLPVREVRLVEDRHPAMMALVTQAEYRIDLAGPGAQAVLCAVDGYLSESSVMAMRKTKSGEKPADIRPMTLALTGVGEGADGAQLSARLMLKEAATLKPDLLVRVLSERAGVEMPKAGILRTRLLGENEAGEAVALMEM